MSTREELDSMLFEYLTAERNDPMRARLKGLSDWQMQHDKQDEQRHVEVTRALDGHNWRMQSLEQQAKKLAEDAEDTGEHQVEDLKQQLADAKRSNADRRNFWLGIAGTVIATIVASMTLAHFGIHP